MGTLRSFVSRAVAATPLAYWPVTVKAGPAAGARWTLMPFSQNWRGEGENDVARGLALLAKVEGAACWDFGAHFGIHTVGMAMQVGPQGEVAAFEPDSVAFKRLSYHVRINRLRNVRLHRMAVSNRTGTENLVEVLAWGSASSHFRYEDEPISQHDVLVSVATVKADDLVSAGKIRLPDLIKVDVQGHGAKALEGARNSIGKAMPIIVFSGHSSWELAETRALLEPLGYAAFSLAGAPLEWPDLGSDPCILRALGGK